MFPSLCPANESEIFWGHPQPLVFTASSSMKKLWNCEILAYAIRIETKQVGEQPSTMCLFLLLSFWQDFSIIFPGPRSQSQTRLPGLSIRVHSTREHPTKSSVRPYQSRIQNDHLLKLRDDFTLPHSSPRKTKVRTLEKTMVNSIYSPKVYRFYWKLMDLNLSGLWLSHPLWKVLVHQLG